MHVLLLGWQWQVLWEVTGTAACRLAYRFHNGHTDIHTMHWPWVWLLWANGFWCGCIPWKPCTVILLPGWTCNFWRWKRGRHSSNTAGCITGTNRSIPERKREMHLSKGIQNPKDLLENIAFHEEVWNIPPVSWEHIDLLNVQGYKLWILKTIGETWQLFERKFLALWDQNWGSGDAYVGEVYNSKEVRDLAQIAYMSELFQDSLGFAAAKMIRWSGNSPKD